ncbi:Fe2+ transport system protein FeoA [Caloramator fervidus]|uniref:Fe2+ transport system protein FeoA n=1 Tax=Caloramator fervidus TaxID=29344 RepID=A0A1H5V1F3_9CLOT|nr:ferrous iron transport protein A [Caloramator fervidus]SEF81205.1 Fe2+ transport system protein FeoA [Caloramator fervidus]
MTLDKARVGQKIVIKDILDENIRVQAIRLGLYKGANVVCSAKIPFGPIIVGNKFQEIAVGRELAKKIEIDIVS